MYATWICCNKSQCYLQHVHHFLQLCGFDARGLLHGETLEVFNDAKPVDLSLLVFQKLLQDHTIGSEDLEQT